MGVCGAVVCRYDGEWSAGDMHGRGTFYTATWTYTGALVHDRPTQGELTEAGGRRFLVEYAADCAFMHLNPVPKTKVASARGPARRRLLRALVATAGGLGSSALKWVVRARAWLAAGCNSNPHAREGGGRTHAHAWAHAGTCMHLRVHTCISAPPSAPRKNHVARLLTPPPHR